MAAKSPAATTLPTANKPTKTRKKSPLTAEEFEAAAKPVLMTIGDSKVVANVQRQKDGTIGFSSGSLGWYAGGKIVMDVNGLPVECQMSVNITVIGSKPEEAEAA